MPIVHTPTERLATDDFELDMCCKILVSRCSVHMLQFDGDRNCVESFSQICQSETHDFIDRITPRVSCKCIASES